MDYVPVYVLLALLVKVDDTKNDLERIDPQMTIDTTELNKPANKDARDRYFNKGLELIREGRVTTVILAGG